MNASERHHLIPARKVEGAAVYGSHRQRLGSVSEVIIDKASGFIAYVDLSTGGFLGIGNHHHRIRWDALHYDPQLGGYAVEAELNDLPEFTNDPAVGGQHATAPMPTSYSETNTPRTWL